MQVSARVEIQFDPTILLGFNTLGTAGGACGGGGGGGVACFVAGTSIMTIEGEKPVESLDESDVLLTAQGEQISLVWLGHRTINLTKAENRLQLLPVMIKAGALGPGVPNRDLLVSGDHALFLHGVLVPAVRLINGGTIVQVEVNEVTYYHVECCRHVILVANGAAAESYLDIGDRGFFANGPNAVNLHPKLPVEELRRRLAAPGVNRVQLSEIRKANFARALSLGVQRSIGADVAAIAATPRKLA